ncbi:MAG: spore coat protein [Oscillospiraceae bacterium]|nr:spore coat protein [Oscillospiraceae bacterium]
MQLTQKEATLLKDLKDQEKLCIDKYNKYASSASDQQLGQLFRKLSEVEQSHLKILDDIGEGKTPQFGGASSPSMTFTATYGPAETEQKKNDCYLCTDTLTMEKHASHLYDTCVFEFKNEALRTALNKIQAQEQEHGKLIYDYMSQNGMYC